MGSVKIFFCVLPHVHQIYFAKTFSNHKSAICKIHEKKPGLQNPSQDILACSSVKQSSMRSKESTILQDS